MTEPSTAHRRFAADARAMFTALTDEGFTDDQAVALLCRLVDQPPTPARPDRAAQVEALLAGKRKSATRGPVDDRATDLWNPPKEPA